MNDLINRSGDELHLEGLIENQPISFSFTDLKRGIPKVNFKKIKLSKFNGLDDPLKAKNITKISLDDSLKTINFPTLRKSTEIKEEDVYLNPLRKKSEPKDAIPQIIFKESEEKPEKKPDIPSLQEQLQEEEEELEVKPEASLKPDETKDVTFNLEAQISHEDEAVIFSPATVSMPPLEEGIVSSSGEPSALVWPPSARKEKSKKKLNRIKDKKSKSKKKSKAYYISEDSEKPKQAEKPFQIQPTAFPWSTSGEQYEGLETLFGGGLESELVEFPEIIKSKPEESKITPEKPIVAFQAGVPESEVEILYKKSVVEKPITTQVLFKAISPRIPEDLLSDIFRKPDAKEIASDTSSLKSNKVNFGVGSLGKAKKMFGKPGGSKIPPIRIVIYGGITVTIIYLLYNQYFPDVRTFSFLQKEKSDVVVKDLFKPKTTYKKDIKLKPQDVAIKEDKEESKSFSPITENERLAIIQKAKESLEGRLDPFGQDIVLPTSVQEQLKEKEEEEAPKDIPRQRKQVELVGVISAKTKNIALVNLYTADYSVLPDDDKTVQEEKLKAALSMAVPNRIEVSVLDPVEDWNVRVINKSKARTEDPTIELVRDDKKFKLKVGQKVLLPDENPPLPEVDTQTDDRVLDFLPKAGPPTAETKGRI